MYERSAIVLERYFDTIFGFDKKFNLKSNYKNYKEIVEEIEKYQIIVTKEDKETKVFDEIVERLEKIQKAQDKLCNENTNLEDERKELFNDYETQPETLEKNLKKIETTLTKNNSDLEELREEYIKYLLQFWDKKEIRDTYRENRKNVETNYFELIKKANNELENIDEENINKLEELITLSNSQDIQDEIKQIMMENGKSERVGFNEEVIKKAVENRINIAKKEAECYILAYKKIKKLLEEINDESLRLGKYQKALRNISVKLEFIEAEKVYLVGFLDNERITAINGEKLHNQMMKEACNNFETDIKQINNLYQLILKETADKPSKKAYKEFYNKTYLKSIVEKEKKFQQEINNIRINVGTIINSNYWRIEGIKNIYEVFKEQIEENFKTDLTEFQLEEIEEPIKETQIKVKPKQVEKEEIKKEIRKELPIIEVEEDDDEEYYEDEDYEDEDEGYEENEEENIEEDYIENQNANEDNEEEEEEEEFDIFAKENKDEKKQDEEKPAILILDYKEDEEDKEDEEEDYEGFFNNEKEETLKEDDYYDGFKKIKREKVQAKAKKKLNDNKKVKSSKQENSTLFNKFFGDKKKW